MNSIICITQFVYQFFYVQRKAVGVLLKTVSQIKNFNQSHIFFLHKCT